MRNERITAGNSTFAIGAVSYSADNFVVTEYLFFLTSFTMAENTQVARTQLTDS
ncbi:MAG: hypothetical protein ABIY50_11070 [Ignavibacteria bacterium]